MRNFTVCSLQLLGCALLLGELPFCWPKGLEVPCCFHMIHPLEGLWAWWSSSDQLESQLPPASSSNISFSFNFILALQYQGSLYFVVLLLVCIAVSICKLPPRVHWKFYLWWLITACDHGDHVTTQNQRTSDLIFFFMGSWFGICSTDSNWY